MDITSVLDKGLNLVNSLGTLALLVSFILTALGVKRSVFQTQLDKAATAGVLAVEQIRKVREKAGDPPLPIPLLSEMAMDKALVLVPEADAVVDRAKLKTLIEAAVQKMQPSPSSSSPARGANGRYVKRTA